MKKKIWIMDFMPFLVVPLWTSILHLDFVKGSFVVDVTQSSYQAEENHNITLEWTFTTKPDTSLSSLKVFCILNNGHKSWTFYHLFDGVEFSEDQDKKFSGRVQSDKDGLREGRIRLQLSRLRTEDSGLYLCEVDTGYGRGYNSCRLTVSGIDCFGPYKVKTGRRSEKRWGIIFKCLTTRCIHLDLLNSMDTDSFLMALQRFISRRGTPLEIICDQGTNFKGGDKELWAAFNNLAPTLQPVLMTKRIHFKFNPPHAPHFGGAWEREIRSVKNALKRTIGAQMFTEEVLRTVLIEVEGILNSKPLGYVSSDIADIDPITPNLLLMGRHDSSLPLVSYSDSDLLGRRRWRHAQILADHFWRHFIKDYLLSLQRRPKWQKENPDLT
ncbi:uncharacterized protein LOC143415116 isoform X1 [Maylandia zebra]|uniref:uncharacterized protein LOC112429741 isoform X1 n=1 Tax=Maylandia zebra TaxID=106582 RepID=UPI00403C2DA7